MNDELRMKLTEFLKKYFSKLCEFIPQFIIHNYIKGGGFLDFYKSYKKPLKIYCFII